MQVQLIKLKRLSFLSKRGAGWISEFLTRNRFEIFLEVCFRKRVLYFDGQCHIITMSTSVEIKNKNLTHPTLEVCPIETTKMGWRSNILRIWAFLII